MSRILSTASALFLAAYPLSVGAQQHIWDMRKDAPHWNRSSDCPGPHYESIFFRDSWGSQARICVDKDSIVRLPNGGRARFTNIMYNPGSGYTSYMTNWYEVKCKEGALDSDSGYSVQNKASDSYFPIPESPGWYEFIWEGKRRSNLMLGRGDWLTMTSVGPKDRFFCPKL
jgi:hypothetical protein